MKAALYVRVSTAEQKKYGLSVDSQIDALQKYCKEKNLEFEIYNDAGISARKSYKKRPALLKMIKDCQDGGISIILFTKLDRFFRSVPDYYACMEQIGDVPWRAIWEDYETESSAGVFKVNIMLAVSQSEADRTSERIKSINEYRREKGEYLGGNPPIGFNKVNRKLVVDESLSESIRAVFESYATYYSADECIQVARAAGLDFSRNTMYKMLRNELYKEIVPEEMFHRVQVRLDEKPTRKPIGDSHSYIFKGLVRCGCCEHSMTASARKRYSDVRGNYTQYIYQCHNYTERYNGTEKCKNPASINEEILEQIVLSQIEQEITEHNLYVDSVSQTKDQEAEKKIKKLNDRLERLKELYEIGDITLPEYKKKRDTIRSEVSEASRLINQQIHYITLPCDWKLLYEKLDSDHKRAFWCDTIQSIVIEKGRKITIKL